MSVHRPFRTKMIFLQAASFYDNQELKSRFIELITAAMYLKHGFLRSALENQHKLLRIVAPSLAGHFIRSPYLFL